MKLFRVPRQQWQHLQRGSHDGSDQLGSGAGHGCGVGGAADASSVTAHLALLAERGQACAERREHGKAWITR